MERGRIFETDTDFVQLNQNGLSADCCARAEKQGPLRSETEGYRASRTARSRLRKTERDHCADYPRGLVGPFVDEFTCTSGLRWTIVSDLSA
jgi:hypothetical protein